MLVVLDISSYYLGGCFVAYRSNEIPITAKFTTPKVPSQLWRIIKHYLGAYSFENIYSLCWGVPRGCREKKMDMVRHHFHRICLKFILARYFMKDLFEPIGIDFRKYLFPILWYPYQMVLGIIYRMRGSLEWGHTLHYFLA